MDQELLIKYIKGETTFEETRQILAWKKEDEKNMTELLTLRKMYDILLWEEEGETAEIVPGKTIGKNRYYRVASIAAAVLLLFGSGIWIGVSKRTPEITMQTIRVPAGQRAEIMLADGSTVWLNAGTTLSFPNFFTKKREVILDGQAFFDVKKNSRQPFLVKTDNHMIEVLGTEFDVMAYKKSPSFSVSLISGSVEVSSIHNGEKVILEPGARVWLENGKLNKEDFTNPNNLLWKEGVIYFDDEPVDRMIQILELYFDTRIIIENEMFRNKKYTGKFRTKDGIDHILRVFRLKDKFIYEKDEEKNVITIK